MNRPWQTWVLFALCLGLVLAAMAWISLTALRLEAAQAHAQRQAEALWRMDFALAPLIAQENARPYFAWYAFWPAERAYGRMSNTALPGETMVPSPLLTQPSPHVLLYFLIRPDGRTTSPQLPDETYAAAMPGLVPPERMEQTALRLRELEGRVDRSALLAALPAEPPAASLAFDMLPGPNAEGVTRGGKGGAELPALNIAEYGARARGVEQAQRAALPRQQAAPSQLQQIEPYGPIAQEQTQMPRGSGRGVDPLRAGEPAAVQQADQVTVGLMKPLWMGDALLLVRHVRVDGRSYVQGCWLDWPAIRQWLLLSVQDVLPSAELVPVREDARSGSTGSFESAGQEWSRRLAALPVQLVPGRPAGLPVLAVSAIRVSLLLAWTCVVLAAAAVAALLAGAVTLSERRAAFVSAVTHELRTPLTTLRMYTEMLAGGMVPDEAKRQRYLETLQREADRLAHLVENVLAYARLERSRGPGRIDTLPLQQVLERAGERLRDRCAQARMRLDVQGPAEAEPVLVRADLSAVEQVLFNLVDNACKYAADGSDRCVEIRTGRQGRWGVLRVCDHGPGIGRSEARRLFRPFSKSASDAAHSAPGVGLGLALSRRLARQMGGDLRLEHAGPGGACFVLTLPAA